MTKRKTSKELQAIFDAVDAYHKKHDGNVQFLCSIMAFKGEKCNVVDDRLFAYGPKECIELDLSELAKEVKKEKKDFINW